MKVYSVYQINSYIRGLLDDDMLLSGICVEGEISNFKEHSSGHLYFTLKDERASISSVMFKGYAGGLNFRPQNGLRVIALGRVSAYEKSGQYQLYTEMMEPSGTGGLYLSFIQLKARLEAEGLFAAERKRPIPVCPACAGVVTSPDGAALRDIINVAGRRNPGVKLVISPASVQGAGAAEEIAGAIKRLNEWSIKKETVDVIIVGRGGGSMEDLWAFNEEVLARAVASSRIPVISAVGHETDYTICDFAADLRAPTPSAAVELCIPDVREILGEMMHLQHRLDIAVEIKLDNLACKLERLKPRFPEPHRLTEAKAASAAVLTKRLHREIAHKLDTTEVRAVSAIRLLQMAAPLNVLKRGYSLLYIGGEVIKSVSAAEGAKGKNMTVRLSDGEVSGVVEGTNQIEGR